MIKCVVPVSGGKDSQLCLLLATQRFAKDEIVGLFCDTKFEHPKTYAHVDAIEQRYGVQIDHISDGDVPTRCLRYGRFPSGVARFCTDDLKIKPTKRYLENLAARQGYGFEVWYGMRGNESPERRARYAEHISTQLYLPHEVLPKKYPEHLGRMGVRFRLPILDLTKAEVFDALGGFYNPLYDEGFDRVGCFPCLAAGDKYKAKAFEHDDTGRNHRSVVMMIEARIGKSVFTSKGMKDQGCAICSI